MVDETKMMMMPVDSKEGGELWEQMFSNGVVMPVRIVPTIASYNKEEDYFILSFGFGADPMNIEQYRTVAIPISAMEAMLPDIKLQIDEYNMSKAN